MPKTPRQIPVQIYLTPDEMARLEEIKPPSMSRGAFFRTLLTKPPNRDDISTHEEALAILSAQARDGSATAAVALEKALREQMGPMRKPKKVEDELEAIAG